ncbi:MAG: hypothetical protein IPM29_08880 [Planctomycetes bacterium]|nr:hypothetical protein [Planctomycetota bacterium]
MSSLQSTKVAPPPQRPSESTPQAPRADVASPQTATRHANPPAGFAPARERRASPDPLRATDRYRLTMPYVERID